MIRKTIIFGGLLASFLILMIPNVKTVEYNQVTNSIEEKINVLAERINQRLDRVNENQLSALNKLIDVEGLRFFLNEITNNKDSICLACSVPLSPECIGLLIDFLTYFFLGILFLAILIGFLLWSMANETYKQAEAINCYWTTILSNPFEPFKL